MKTMLLRFGVPLLAIVLGVLIVIGAVMLVGTGPELGIVILVVLLLCPVLCIATVKFVIKRGRSKRPLSRDVGDVE